MQTTRTTFSDRRTPRRKLVFSSSDDETDDSPQSISILHNLRQEYHHSIIQDEQLSTKSEITTSIVTRSKLEHYGFNMLARPASKRQPLTIQNQNKKIRSNESRHSMQTRSQSSSDSHSDNLVNLFDKTLSTVTPNPVRNRQRRLKPLPLCLSDNEKNMPILTVVTTEENLNKRTYDEDENSENCRSIKRSKIFDETNKENNLSIKSSRRGISLMRSLTDPNEEQIKQSVELGCNRELVGDRSRSYLLPRCKSRKHPDLACISPETMVDILGNIYSSEIENLHIIDCRYPYEYEGGHIQSAKNIYTRSQVYDEYFRKPLELSNSSKRNIFIFHCEFSSERAPSMLRYFRSEDRNIHEKNYPQLHYPEIYLLEGGYKAFYEYSKEFCLPNQYRTMIDVDYQEQYRQYRFETKQFDKFTGANETTGGGRRTRGLTFRSCLSFSSHNTNQCRSSNIRYDLRYTESPPQY
ncbi:unnamed protein product [Adineta steineri]|uniref:M-phase inducer phosphatase n=1 Tax=Adineta steineri TaxID=433720 RepID=A0A813S9I1_9BILA|nr:unnamed protein product [Adineta steineri]CAF0791957.1 unnamed protein product [Adineta steineri]CAF0894126.1 unnamed protein product [Adineta steineri]